MNTWFECTAKYIKMDETGHEKKASETYLLDAISFTEAESRIYKELQTMVSGEFVVSRIAKTRISEIIPSDNGDRWYKAKVTFITVDEESGKEKRVSQSVLVFSDNVKEAYDQIIVAMEGRWQKRRVCKPRQSDRRTAGSAVCPPPLRRQAG